MYDALLYSVSKAEKQSDISDKLGLEKSGYLLLTLHRPANTDSSETLDKIMSAIAKLTHHEFVFPVHPRTRKAILQSKVKFPKNLQVIDPVGYLDILALEKNAAMILTDSGGVQEEACIVGVPCVTLRDNTERPETVAVGANVLAGATPEKILGCARDMLKRDQHWENPFGDGRAGVRIVDVVLAG